MLDLAPGDPQLRHIDRAWASTVHAFQGRTVDTVIAVLEANHPNLTSMTTFCVEISRARDWAALVTDDRAALRETLEAMTGERIAALEAVEPVRAKDRAAGLDRTGARGGRAAAATRRSRNGAPGRTWKRRGHRRASIAISDCKGPRLATVMRRFNALHRASVIVNAVQMLAVLVVLVRYAAP